MRERLNARAIVLFLAATLCFATGSLSQETASFSSHWKRIKEEKNTNSARSSELVELLQSRLDLTIPDWWKKRLYLIANGLGSGGPRDKTTDEVLLRELPKRNFEIEQNGVEAKLKFEADGVLVELDSRFVDAERIPETSIGALQLQDGSVIVARLREDSSFMVAKIQNRSDIAWMQEKVVRDASERPISYTGVALDACVEILEKKGTIVVVGARMGVSCIYVFDLDHGDELDAGVFDQLR